MNSRRQEMADMIARDLRVLPGYQDDPIARMTRALDHELSMARYSGSMIPPEMKKGTDVDLTGLDCVHYQDKEYWVEEGHFESQSNDGKLTFENEEGEEVEPVLVREIP